MRVVRRGIGRHAVEMVAGLCFAASAVADPGPTGSGALSGGVLMCGAGACLRAVPALIDGQPNTCLPGEPLPEDCNGVDDDCDGLTDEIGCSAPSPRSLGYYRRLCGAERNRSGDAITLSDAACVNDAATFAWVSTPAAVCEVIEGRPSGDRCAHAEATFMTLLLNRCRSRVWDEAAIESGCSAQSTVDGAIADADALLSSPERTRDDCSRARCEAEDLNSGKALR